LPHREEPATLPPVQAHPAQPAPEQAQPAQIQPEQTKPGTSKPELRQPAVQPKSAAADAKPDHAAPGLPASEIIKRFVEEARKNSARSGAAKGEAGVNIPAKAEPPARPSAEPAETPPARPSGEVASAAPAKPGKEPLAPQAATSPRPNGPTTPQPEVQAAIESQLPGWTKLQPPSGKELEEAPAETAKTPAREESASPAGVQEATPETRRPPPAPPQADRQTGVASAPRSQGAPPKPVADAAQAPAPKATAPAAQVPKVAPAVQAQPSDRADRQSEEPDTGAKAGETIAMNVPRPSVPPSPATPFEKAALWLRDFSGGDCFYAAPDSTGGTAFGIVGFGTTPDPFVKLMKAFNAEFGSEPDIQVRLISPSQCALTRFMRGFDPPAGNLQTLTLDRTSVANGSPISGVLATEGGLRSNLLLIDHDGMTYNIDRLLIVDGDKAKFSARISLDPAARAKGKPMPEIVLAITGAVDIRSASTLQAAPASEVLPKIRDEIRRSGAAFSATAKYFQLGG
jgi:serine/threonine-protein kinase